MSKHKSIVTVSVLAGTLALGAVIAPAAAAPAGQARQAADASMPSYLKKSAGFIEAIDGSARRILIDDRWYAVPYDASIVILQGKESTLDDLRKSKRVEFWYVDLKQPLIKKLVVTPD